MDVGTGTGRLALQLARMGAQVTGFDASLDRLSVARERAQAEALTMVRFEKAALGDALLPAASESVDLLPNMPHSRAAYLKAVQVAGCTLIDCSDLSLDGKPYGGLSDEEIRARGEPPFCLIILAQKE